LCHAKSHITRSHTAIICEGPGNCWALDAAGIQNSVAIFGLTISKQQRQLLQQAGALTLIVAFDNDKAGQDAKARLAKNLEHYFRLFFVEPNSDDDVGSMSAEAIQEQFGDLIGRFSRELK
jgi:DNA primase